MHFKMKYLLAFLLLWMGVFGFSQEKQIKKSERLYSKGKYEKCIHKTQKYLKKYRKNADLQNYIVLSQIAIFDEKADQKKFYQLKRILRDWDKLNKYRQNKTDDSSLASSIQKLIYMELENPGISQRNQGYLHEQLAEVFQDTTVYYRSKHQLEEPSKEVKEKTPIDTDSLFFLDAKRRALVQRAINQIGVPYKYGGADSTGFDCSGFIQFLYQGIGIELPHNAQLQSELGEPISLEEAQTGDLIFFGQGRAAHAGMIYINQHGEPELIHCVSRGVSHDTDEDNNHIHWMNRPFKVKRYLYSKN